MIRSPRDNHLFPKSNAGCDEPIPICLRLIGPSDVAADRVSSVQNRLGQKPREVLLHGLAAFRPGSHLRDIHRFGSSYGGRTRTGDLLVMSQLSCRCSTPQRGRNPSGKSVLEASPTLAQPEVWRWFQATILGECPETSFGHISGELHLLCQRPLAGQRFFEIEQNSAMGFKPTYPTGAMSQTMEAISAYHAEELLTGIEPATNNLQNCRSTN